MIRITFNAFSFLQKKLKEKNIAFSDASLEISSNTSVKKLISQFQLTENDVEGVFVNGKIVPFDLIIQDNDRVAFIPPGTPGPYRVMLGIVQNRPR